MNLHPFKGHHREKAVQIFIWAGIAFIFFLSATAAIGAFAYGYNVSYRNKIYPGVHAGTIRLDGLTQDQARGRLKLAIETATNNGYHFTIDGAPVTLPSTVLSVDDPDLAHDITLFDIDATVDKAFHAGRYGDFFQNTLDRLRLILRPLSVPLVLEINRPLVKKSLEEHINDRLVPAIDAQIHVRINTTSTPETVSFNYTKEQMGKLADVDGAINTLASQAALLAFQPIPITITNVEPMIQETQLQALEQTVSKLLAHAPFTLRADNKTWQITSSTLAEWIGPIQTQGVLTLAIVPDKLLSTMEPLAANLLQEPKDGRLELGENETVVAFEEPIAGVRIDPVQTIKNITEGWTAGSTPMELVLQTVTPKIAGSDASRLGIQEVLGIGRSNYSGSPSHRRQNIALGASKMNGTLIAPGAEFSQLDTLDTIDGAHGWLTELVIKDNKTIPEYGGGLCQIGTTSFRAALAAGMEITERRNHSYRVSYYEPAGTDATIYDPAPDFRFRNNTSHYILVTSRVQNNEVITTIWGTYDGRKISQSKPVIWGITAPPPTKYIETTDLPPGKKHCTESAHAGASASFNYNVQYADGTEDNTTFNSYYKPWQAVCLIGVESLSGPSSSTTSTQVLPNP